LVDYQSSDYRGFLFVVHNEYGLLLLHCTRKKNKPPHWQLPGGHVDDFEFLQAATAVHPPTRTHQLLHAGKSGASRELYEETGIDVRNQLDRIAPVHLQRSDTKTFKDGTKLLPNEYKQRLFFLVQVTDQDFAKPGQGVHAFGIGEPDCKYKHIQVSYLIN
jgi:8-oxo-dGTP pyrophosphatase MutT (NUDIX family)